MLFLPENLWGEKREAAKNQNLAEKEGQGGTGEAGEAPALAASAESFARALRYLILSHPNAYMQWCLIQAPVKIVDPAKTGVKTAAAGSDGYIYVNPFFWNRILALAGERIERELVPESERERMAAEVPVRELCTVLFHEALHLMLGHMGIAEKAVTEARNRGLPPKLCIAVGNVCADYIVNSICREENPESWLLSGKLGEDLQGVTEANVRDFLRRLGVDADSLPLGLKPPYAWKWGELFGLCLEHLAVPAEWETSGRAGGDLPGRNGEEREDLRGGEAGGGEAGEPDTCKDGKSEGESREEAEKDEGFEQQGKTEAQKAEIRRKGDAPGGEARGVHGEELGESAVVREGNLAGCGKREEAERVWEQTLHNLLHEMREAAGRGKASLLRVFEDLAEVKLPWESVIRTVLQTAIYSTTVCAAWHRENRKVRVWPGKQFYAPGVIWILGDVSGSIKEKELQEVAGVALSAARQSMSKQEVILLLWDTEVRKEIKIRKAEDLKQLKFQGGGGTQITPAFKYLKSEKLGVGDLVVVYTDSEITDDWREVKKELRRLERDTQNKVVWFHCGRDSAAPSQLRGMPEVLLFEKRRSSLEK